MIEFGIFNDEGCIESGFWSRNAAEDALDDYDPDDDVHVGALCEEHEGQEAEHCEWCWAEWDEGDA